MTEHIDVLIVGAGLSGVAAGYYIKTKCPQKSYAILEARNALGGTWDVFRYPGVRCDSDMYTLGYSFKSWGKKNYVSGALIRKYLKQTTVEFNVNKHIRFQHKVYRIEWSTKKSLWTVSVLGPRGNNIKLTCSFLFMCTGYYEYENKYRPEWWTKIKNYKGQIAHTQEWPQSLDYKGKKVVVIGSGATAITVVPALAKKASHVTMLQRSPTYMISLSSKDRLSNLLHGYMPAKFADRIIRWKNILLQMSFYWFGRSFPELTRKVFELLIRLQLGKNYDLNPNFKPLYKLWDQRPGLVLDGDLFKSIKSGKTSIVTDTIKTFTEKNILLSSGKRLETDIIVMATGFNMRLMAGIEIKVDGKLIDLGKTLTYKGFMLSDIPNLAQAIGYANSSWTLKCELIARYVCRLLNYMDKYNYIECLPKRPKGMKEDKPVMPLASNYIKRSLRLLPNQGSKSPWKISHYYLHDLMTIRFGKINDGVMQFLKI